MPLRTSHEKGAEFESYVASMYESLGFRVQRNVKIKGQEIDLIISRVISGVGEIRTLVECKYLERGTVSNSVIHEFCSFSSRCRELFGFTNAVLVSNREFSLSAKEAAAKEGHIFLKTQLDIEQELFDIVDVLQFSKKEYEESDIFNTFVPPIGVGSFPGRENINTDYDLVKTLLDFASPGGGTVVIFGDFGSGKTTLLDRINYEVARRYLLGDRRFVPIVVRLRERQGHKTLDDFIRHFIVSRFERPIPLRVFWDRLRRGGFLLLLDGFDEISTKVTARDRAAMFHELFPLLATRSPVILTCRPTYFTSAAEYNFFLAQSGAFSQPRVGLYQRISQDHPAVQKYTGKRPERPIQEAAFGKITLQNWDSIEIQKYLKLRLGDTSDAVWAKLEATYDIRDLMSRPLLASLVVDTISSLDPSSRVKKTEELFSNRTELYETYTGVQLHRDAFARGNGSALSSDQRRYFAQALALALLKKGKLNIEYREIFEVIGEHDDIAFRTTPIDDTLPEEAIATDILVCTFLERNADDSFSFTHKSFMDFFIAQYVHDSTYLEEVPRLLFGPIPREAINFLGGYGGFDALFPRQLKETHRVNLETYKNNSIINSNISSIMLLSGDKIKYSYFDGAVVHDLNFFRGAWIGHQFVRTELRECKMAYFAIEQAKFSSALLAGCDIASSEIRETSFHGEILGTVFSDTLLANSIIGTRLSNVTFSNVRMADCSLKLSGTAEFRDGAIRASDAVFEGAGLSVRLKGTQLIGGTAEFVGRWGEGVVLCGAGCTLHDCLILGIGVDERLLSGGALDRTRGIAIAVSTDNIDRRKQEALIRLSEELLIIREHALGEVSLIEQHLAQMPMPLDRSTESIRCKAFLKRFLSAHARVSSRSRSEGSGR